MNDRQFDREMEEIDRLETEGQIDSAEASRQRRALVREYQDCAREAAEQAYDRELDRW